MAPFRYAVRLVNGVERDLDLAQEGYVVLLRERLRCKIEQLGLSGKHVVAHLLYGCLVERGVEEVGNARICRERTHRIDLVFHQCDEGRYDDGHTVHEQCRQLIAQRLSAARRHQHEGILAGQNVAYDSLLIPLKRREAEILFQLFMKHVPALCNVGHFRLPISQF